MTRVTCHDLAQCLSAFVDGELDPSHALAVQHHVSHCKQCESRVDFARACRRSVRNSVRAARPSEAFRVHVAAVVTQAIEVESRSDGSVIAGLMSWRVAGPMAAAAAVVLIWASYARFYPHVPQEPLAAVPAPSSTNAPEVPVDDFVNTLVDQHANPLPPESTNPTEIAQFDRYIGVPIRDVSVQGLRGDGKLLGARMVPVREQRAAMFQYVLGNGRRVSVYVYNPNSIRLNTSPALRKHVVRNNTAPVYTGYIRGYSVAMKDQRGVGYAMASDLDEQENSQLLLAVGGN